jgi:hypothetical protein
MGKPAKQCDLIDKYFTVLSLIIFLVVRDGKVKAEKPQGYSYASTDF